ncbi:DUF1704 domain-containing protein [Luteimonas sp. MC1782]|uniref:flavohemoglobin expression-modulating QEGLA motif protein n=1 Tax=Luteimonas sp. MC1782 TaxID=2760305 RepID=UPI0015FFAF65|nr:tyrosine/phenylalanine carboxypeptidase domain-containing protein [Luteimonas sp. MC1782]MBB1471861.1 DUF1704 domain-containing protein [Luteimonas sp. MC1782]
MPEPAHPAPRVQKPPAPDFGLGAWRRELDAGGRVHIDRPLPFLVLNRHADDAASIARRLATISAAHLVWPEGGDADAGAVTRLDAVLAHQVRDFPNYLLLWLHDLPRDASIAEDSTRLEPFRFTVSASGGAAAHAAARRLRVALAGACIELREAVIEESGMPDLPAALAALVERSDGIGVLSLGLPRIYLAPGSDAVYPQVFHELETLAFDAVLQALAAFVEAATPGIRVPHRTLGRSRFIKAAVAVDRELAAISASFDFLLSVSPINTVEAMERYHAAGREHAPEFRYRPLTVSPELSKRALYSIDVSAVEDPVLEQLFLQKQREIDLQLTMLQGRNTPAFKYASIIQYGAIEAPLLEEARGILARVDATDDREDTACVDCHAVREAAEAVIAGYRHKASLFKAEVCLRDDIAPGLMVSGRSVLVSTATRMRRWRLDALLQHEIGVHVLTCVNGGAQGLSIFGSGLAGYEGIQEGLGVFAEFLVGGLGRSRLRLLAARVVVVDAMLDGAGFVDCDRMLCRDHGFGARAAFTVVARVFRSGGLAKDAIYLRGLNEVFAWVAGGKPLDAFWTGKIAASHVPVVDELRARGILREPAVLPEFLSRPEARARLARVRGGEPFLELVQG